jgi:hypothetical protein
VAVATIDPADVAAVAARALAAAGLEGCSLRLLGPEALVEYVDAFFSFFVDGIIDQTTVLPTVREVLGREPRSFGELVARHQQKFR